MPWIMLAVPPTLVASMSLTRLWFELAGNPSLAPSHVKDGLARSFGLSAVLMATALGPHRLSRS